MSQATSIDPVGQAARAYLARGWNVLPVGADKRPRLASWAGLQRRHATADEVSAWFVAAHGVGIVTGRVSGLVVLDLDNRRPGELARARERLAALLPAGLVTPTARTQSGGEHVYLAAPPCPLGNRAHVEGLALDARADGGYVVAPPTPGYAWIVPPTEAETAPMPPDLRRLLARAEPEPPEVPKLADVQPGEVPARVAFLLRARRPLALLWAGVGKLRGDASRSGYDHAVAAALLAAGVRPAEVAAALAARPDAHRRDREYVSRTVARAVASLGGRP